MTDANAQRHAFGAAEAAALLARSPSKTATAGDTASVDDDEAQLLAFAECMRDNGVDMPDLRPGRQGLGEAFHNVFESYDHATIKQAFAACRNLLPQLRHDETHTADPSHDPDFKDDTREEPGRGSKARAPRWVWVFVIVAVVLIVGLILSFLLGVGTGDQAPPFFDHGPGHEVPDQ